ncbi:MAG: FHA domain-containing protein [Planctomycetes bacterium]|nr:FHA domain-containing protein [Planctomycetota bacterium]
MPALPADAAELHVVRSDGSVTTLSLTARHVHIGRERDNDVVLADPSVSRHHAELVRGAAGYWIADRDSRGGIAVGGRRVDLLPLRHGDAVRIGTSVLRYHGPDAVPRRTLPRLLWAVLVAWLREPRRRRLLADWRELEREERALEQVGLAAAEGRAPTSDPTDPLACAALDALAAARRAEDAISRDRHYLRALARARLAMLGAQHTALLTATPDPLGSLLDRVARHRAAVASVIRRSARDDRAVLDLCARVRLRTH